MDRKIISIGIASTFLLIALFSVPAVGMKLEKTNSSWIKIIKPKNGANIHFPIVLESEGSDNIDFVFYSLMYKETWYSSDFWKAEEPPYRLELTKDKISDMGISLEYGSQIKLYASAYRTEGCTSYEIARSEIIEVRITKNRPVNFLEDLFVKFPLLQQLFNLR